MIFIAFGIAFGHEKSDVYGVAMDYVASVCRQANGSGSIVIPITRGITVRIGSSLASDGTTLVFRFGRERPSQKLAVVE